MTPLRTLALVSTVLTLVTTGIAQPPPGTVSQEPGSVNYEQREEGLVEITRNKDGSVSERILTAAEVTDLRKRGDIGAVSAGHMVHGQAYTKPRRLAPGQSGTLKVMAFFGGSCVALPGNHIKLNLEPAAGLDFGLPVLQEAKRGTIEGMYLGKPVYDDFLLFDVPLTVSETVKPPTQIFIKGKLDLVLHNGKTGTRLGAYFAEVGGRVEVGKPLPESNVGVPIRTKAGKGKTAKKPNPTKSKRPPAKTDSSSGGAPGNPAKTGAAEGGTGTLERSGDPSAEGGPQGPDDPAVVTAEGTADYLTWLLGGAVAVVLALLLLVRRN